MIEISAGDLVWRIVFDDGERLDFVGCQFFLPMDEIGC